MNQDTRHFLTLTAGKVINVPLLMINTALLGRILGPDGFGQWSMIVAAATLMHTVLINWTHASTRRFGCEEWVKARSLRRTWSARLPLVLVGFAAAVALLVLQPADWLFRLFSVGKNLWLVVLVYFIGLWLTEEARATLQATSQLTRQAILNITVTCISTLFLVSIMLKGKHGALLWIILGLSAISIIIWGSTWAKTLGRAIIQPQHSTSKEILQHVFFGWALIPSFIMGYIANWGDHIILQVYRSSSELGLFSVSYQVMLGVIALNGTITTVLLPRLIAKNMESDETARNYLVNIVPTIFSLFSLVLMAIIAILPPVFLLLMGESYRNSVPTLLILCVTIPTSILSSLYSVLFNLQQRLDRAFIYLLFMTAVDLGISLNLSPIMGGAGAAVATIVSLAVGQLLYVSDQHYHLKVPLRKVIALFTITFLSSILLLVAGPHLWPRILCFALSAAFLIFLFRQMKTIDPELLSRLFSGRLIQVGILLNRVLVAGQSNR